MIKKVLSFVVDKKGEDIIAPQFVPSHASALRQFQVICERKNDDEPLFKLYPEDYTLVSGILSFDTNGALKLTNLSETPFVNFIRSELSEPKQSLSEEVDD